MKHFQILTLLLLSLSIGSPAQNKLSESELKEHVKFLASDSLKGRFPGTAGSKAAAEYIRNEFKNSKLQLIEDNGFQYFEIITGIEADKADNKLTIGGLKGGLTENFIPLNFSGNADLTAGVSFAGYGLPEDTLSGRKSSYDGIHPTRKWVLILRGTPEAHGRIMPGSPADLRAKVRLAEKHNAAGVLFVSDSKMSPTDELISLSYQRGAQQGNIPVLHIKRELANRILQMGGERPTDAQADRIRENNQPVSFDTQVSVSATVNLTLIKEKTKNVVALLKGNDPDLSDEYIIIGAHYDHLGMGGAGSRNPHQKAVHYGADDNASGTAAVMALAKHFGQAKNQTKRSIIFIAFGAEEMGLLGSAYYADNASIDIAKTYAMINLDMVGRLSEEKPEMSINGTGTAIEFEDILDRFKKQSDIAQAYNPGGFGASDHSSFYVKDIPVLFFTTGAHDDYHTPRDTYDKLNYAGLKKVSEYVAGIVEYLANSKEPLTFQESGSKFDSSKRVHLKATLGVMPGFAATDIVGLRIDGVSEGGPAEAAGLQRGDVIKIIENKEIKDIYEYMEVLQTLEPGQSIIIEIERNEKRITVPVQL